MKNKKILDSMAYIDADLITEAAEYQKNNAIRRSFRRTTMAITACLCLLLGATFLFSTILESHRSVVPSDSLYGLYGNAVFAVPGNSSGEPTMTILPDGKLGIDYFYQLALEDESYGEKTLFATEIGFRYTGSTEKSKENQIEDVTSYLASLGINTRVITVNFSETRKDGVYQWSDPRILAKITRQTASAITGMEDYTLLFYLAPAWLNTDADVISHEVISLETPGDAEEENGGILFE